ncbi:GAD-like domain-containing protein [Actinomyces weissii]|uniref:GAD-related domain-containing protein n=1 Tax=Actinomyces weissii TaxID=675090 RepID=A0A7T7M9S1_9ACTO|nr:GAD-like domain-containing protein [Actinomyces weissii]QQM67448.1 hypothetical protein JG540_00605 [Actinomyces weissii]
MVELRCDSQWVDETVQDGLLDDGWMPMGVGRPVSQEHLERFEGVLPSSVLQIWRRFGFEGFKQGRFWITDPLEWEPVVQAWLADLDLPFPPQNWWCLTRTALGEMQLWGETSGPALSIDPAFGKIRPDADNARDMDNPVKRERMGAIVLTDSFEDELADEDTGENVVDTALERFGALGPDQVLGLTPAYCFTGKISMADVGVHPALSYLVTLAQLQDRRLAQDFSAQAAQVATSIATQAPEDQ